MLQAEAVKTTLIEMKRKGNSRRTKRRGEKQSIFHGYDFVLDGVPDEARRRLRGDVILRAQKSRQFVGIISPEEILARVLLDEFAVEGDNRVTEYAHVGARRVTIDRIDRIEISGIKLREQSCRQMSACGGTDDAHLVGMEMKFRGVRAQIPNGAGRIQKHRGMPVAIAAQAIFQHKGADAMAGKPFGISRTLVVRQIFITSAGQDEKSRAFISRCGRRIGGERRIVVWLAATGQGRGAVPNGKCRERGNLRFCVLRSGHKKRRLNGLLRRFLKAILLRCVLGPLGQPRIVEDIMFAARDEMYPAVGTLATGEIPMRFGMSGVQWK